jgi:hypothetical protein
MEDHIPSTADGLPKWQSNQEVLHMNVLLYLAIINALFTLIINLAIGARGLAARCSFG